MIFVLSPIQNCDDTKKNRKKTRLFKLMGEKCHLKTENVAVKVDEIII